MNKKLIFAGLFAFCAVLPAAADLVEATWPDNDLMQANTKYVGEATEERLGKREGIVSAYPNYSIDPGYYMPADSFTAASCTAGNYCKGGTITSRSGGAQLLTSCGSGYSSAVGSKYEVDCFRSCGTSDVQGDHASTVSSSGKYYKSDINSCGIGSCETGYSVQSVTIPTFSGNNSYSSNSYGWWPAGESVPSAVRATGPGFAFTNLLSSSEIGDLGWAVQNNATGSDSIYFGKFIASSSNDDVLPLTATSDGNNCFCSLTGAIVSTANGGQALIRIATPYINIGFTTSSEVASGSGTYCDLRCESFFRGYHRYVEQARVNTVNSLIAKYTNLASYCKANTYTLTLDANGGIFPSNATQSTTYNYTEMPVIVTAAKPGLPSRGGMIFDGYYDAKTGGTRFYNRQGTQELGVTLPAANTTLYAQWIAEITIKWYGVAASAGGTGNDGYLEAPVEYGTDIETPAAAMTATGQRFLGWKFSK